MQQLANRTDDISDIVVARRDFVQHRGEEEKVVVVHEGDILVGSPRKRLLKLQGGIDTTEPSHPESEL